MYELASEKLEGAGFRQYEISNWAVGGANGEPVACRHNLQYWRNQPYLGFGAGAHGFACGMRTENLYPLQAYIHSVRVQNDTPFPCGPAMGACRSLTQLEEMQETMMVGLRLTVEGVRRQRFMQRFGISIEQAFPKQLHPLIRNGLLEWGGEDGESLRLTRRGRLLGNRVFMEFVGED